MTEIQKKLFELQDKEYKEFQCKLIPTVDPETVIGVRTPDLRKLAKQLTKDKNTGDFLEKLPHRYYEENNLHGFIIEMIKDYDACVKEIDRFLPYVDNWATCDLMSPKVFQKHPEELIVKIKEWLDSKETYTVRFALGTLLAFYLDDAFQPEYLEWAASIRSREYYINMMIAWYFATALFKQYEAAVPYLEQKRLDVWTHNKTIQKAVESRRITEEQKKYLRSLKQKANPY